jgi:hypothetical protein
MQARYTARRPQIGAAGAAVCVPFPAIVLPFRAMLWRGLADVHGIGLEQIGLGHGDLLRVFDSVGIFYCWILRLWGGGMSYVVLS